MLKLYQGRLSVCAVKVRLVLAEKGLDWEPINLNLRAGEQHKPEYLELNPNGVVPTLVHDGFVIIESSVIMQYVDDVFAQPPLQPREPRARVPMRLWMKRIDEYLHPASATLTYAMVHGPTMRKKSPAELTAYYAGVPNPITRARQRAAIEQGLESPDAAQALVFCRSAIADMERQLESQPWLAGESYSLADAAMTPYINRLTMLGLSNMWKGSHPHVTDWFGRILERPSFATAVDAFAAPADMQPYAGIETWAWEKARSILAAA
ncbi:MAG TPA: glutathione S-transferase family protein [Pseudolabrys sp.]|jgi:glutathione S-transferase|nr:glutathione S-transferase family protein [Pseudolabrys sp.]